MNNYKIKIENKENAYEELANRIDQIRYENSEKIFNVLLDYEDEDDKIFDLILKITSTHKVIITLQEKVNDDDIIIIGNVNKNMSIITNHNIKVLGEFAGNIYSKKPISIYANSFINCNLICDNKIIFIEEKYNDTINSN